MKWSAWWLGVLLGWSAVCGGCTRLPDFAAPKGGVIDPSKVDRSDTIRYRTLTRDDFRAEQPPAHLAEHAQKLGALTCANVITTPDTQVQIRQDPEAGTYVARLLSLGFIAEMDRKCSWWNTKQKSANDAYVLQHEQIHFALAELAARRQNVRAARMVSELVITASSAEDAQRQIQEQVTSVVQDAMEELIEENHDFDVDTSLEHDPEKQDEWFRRVTAELAATKA